jgi:hypothetical protein
MQYDQYGRYKQDPCEVIYVLQPAISPKKGPRRLKIRACIPSGNQLLRTRLHI